jgi:hypothetical protein
MNDRRLNGRPRVGTVLIGLIAILCRAPGVAGLNEGIAAIVKGDCAVALKELRPLAERGNAEAQYRLARMWSSV